MYYVVTKEEISHLRGLPHLQQLLYLTGIKPYVDFQTGMAGIKRRISYQSLAEELYIEPHQGIQSGSPSRQQLRRAIKSLERHGIINIQSDDKHLVLKCLLLTPPYSVQNKADTNPTPQATTNPTQKASIKSTPAAVIPTKAGICQTVKADIPHDLKNNICIVLLREQFEKFWATYPQPQNKPKAWHAFQQLNPDAELFESMMSALEVQITHYSQARQSGHWVPHWKYPANWLIQQCWNDELICYSNLENVHATHCKNTRSSTNKDLFWTPELDTEERQGSNVIQLKRYREAD